jgi:enoyl-CoA hydratase
MPETGIGLFPDVGGGWYLSRLPGRIGQYLALTGHRLDGAECLALGLASHYLPSEGSTRRRQRIAAEPQRIAAILDELSVPVPDARILAHRDRSIACSRPTGWKTSSRRWKPMAAMGQAQQLATLRTKSPQTMKVSLRLLRKGAMMPTFADEMRQEYAVGAHVVQRHDFLEGVRACDRRQGQCAAMGSAHARGVTDHVIDQIFAPLPDGEAWTPA